MKFYIWNWVKSIMISLTGNINIKAKWSLPIIFLIMVIILISWIGKTALMFGLLALFRGTLVNSGEGCIFKWWYHRVWLLLGNDARAFCKTSFWMRYIKWPGDKILPDTISPTANYFLIGFFSPDFTIELWFCLGIQIEIFCMHIQNNYNLTSVANLIKN